MKQDKGVAYTIRRAIQAKLKSSSLQQTGLRHRHQSDTENKVDGHQSYLTVVGDNHSV